MRGSEINRRKIRKSLKQSRRVRRIGTKTKMIPGQTGQCYRYFRRQVERPRVKVEREVRRILREARQKETTA